MEKTGLCAAWFIRRELFVWATAWKERTSEAILTIILFVLREKIASG
jgi:hypothetical protein